MRLCQNLLLVEGVSYTVQLYAALQADPGAISTSLSDGGNYIRLDVLYGSSLTSDAYFLEPDGAYHGYVFGLTPEGTGSTQVCADLYIGTGAAVGNGFKLGLDDIVIFQEETVEAP